MARTTTTKVSTKSSGTTQSHSKTTGRSETASVLDEALRDEILSGLSGFMTDEEIEAYAERLLRPQLNAGLEASQQAYETEKLMREQEIEDLASALQRDIGEQRGAYRQSMADIETAALSRGMGRSSYTLQTLANQGDALAAAIRELTQESEAQREQIRDRITQAAQQNAQTQGRLNTDYASNLAAKVQELREQQRQEQNQHYLTATSAAMGKKTTSEGTTDTTGSSTSQSSTTRVVTSSSGGGSSGRSKKAEDEVDAVSGAAVSVKNLTRDAK